MTNTEKPNTDISVYGNANGNIVAGNNNQINISSGNPSENSSKRLEEYYRIALNWDKETSLRNFDLRGRNLEDINLSNADLIESNLSDSNLRNTKLSGAKLRNTNFSDADLTNADLRWADLDNSNLTNANISNANLKYAKLSSTNFTGTNLENATLANVNLHYSNITIEQLLATKTLLLAKLQDGKRYDGRFNLENDTKFFRTYSMSFDSSLSNLLYRAYPLTKIHLKNRMISEVRRHYGVSEEEYLLGQKWAEENGIEPIYPFSSQAIDKLWNSIPSKYKK